MKLKILEDNNTFIDMYYLGEPGVSYYIEDDDEKILFDVGYSSVIIENAKRMGVELKDIQKLVLSHGHNDHTGGLIPFFQEKKNVELIAHPDCFHVKEDDHGLSIGCPLKEEELTQVCQLRLSKEPIFISKHIVFLGEIPVSNDFESRYSIGNYFPNGEKKKDFMMEDSAIVYQSEKGLFVITGCSHSGICNILEYAKKVCHDNRIYGVIGGFHLLEVNDRLKKTIDYLKSQNIKLLYPCHCVSLKAKIEMAKSLEIQEVGVGLEIQFK